MEKFITDHVGRHVYLSTDTVFYHGEGLHTEILKDALSNREYIEINGETRYWCGLEEIKHPHICTDDCCKKLSLVMYKPGALDTHRRRIIKEKLSEFGFVLRVEKRTVLLDIPLVKQLYPYFYSPLFEEKLFHYLDNQYVEFEMYDVGHALNLVDLKRQIRRQIGVDDIVYNKVHISDCSQNAEREFKILTER